VRDVSLVCAQSRSRNTSHPHSVQGAADKGRVVDVWREVGRMTLSVGASADRQSHNAVRVISCMRVLIIALRRPQTGCMLA
jgi:hypothetical protein